MPDGVTDGQSVSLVDSEGHCLGCGIFDRRDPCAAWRRYSHAEAVPFDEAYLSLQAARAGAERVVAVDLEEDYVKAIGANAQRNGLQVEAVAADASTYLKEAGAGEFDAIVLDPPAPLFKEKAKIAELHYLAFAFLPPGGLLAAYCRDVALAECESLVAEAAARAGREARIFARTSQPFDFPMLLNFPESQVLRGLILQVL